MCVLRLISIMLAEISAHHFQLKCMDGHTLWYVHVCIEYNPPTRDIRPVTCISSIKEVVHESTTLSQGI